MGRCTGAKGHRGQADEGEELVEVVDEEGGVLEKPEQDQVEAHAEAKRRPAGGRQPAAVDEQARSEIAKDGGKHHQQVDPLAPGVEQQAGNKEQDIAPPPPAATVQEKNRGQKKEEKGDGTENHKEPRWVGDDGSALSARFAPGADCVVKPDFPCHGKGGMRGARHKTAEVTGEPSRRGRVDRPQRMSGGAGERCGSSSIRTNATNRVVRSPSLFLYKGLHASSTATNPVSVRTKRGRATASIWARSGGESMAA